MREQDRQRLERLKKAAFDRRKSEALQGRKLHRGFARDDGLVFWRYSASCTNGELWVTPEQLRTRLDHKNTRHKARYANDPLFALKERLRVSVSAAYKRKGIKKNSKTEAMLGCTYAAFRHYIESLFLPGMTWTNMPKWHIDHITPLDAAKTKEDVYALNHYTNLRPLWGKDNQTKNTKLPEKHELPENLHPKVREIWERAASNAPDTPNHQE